MTYSSTAAHAVFGAAALALVALAALHVLRPDIHPARTMISQYALGKYGWVMTLFFTALSVASAGLFAALMPQVQSLLGRIGMAFLFAAAAGLAMAARFPMDPVATPPERISFSGRMHGVAFMIGVPCQLLAVLLLSLALGHSHASLALLALTAVIWLSLANVIAIMLIVGPGKSPNPHGPERFLGAPNRLFMVAYGIWLMVAAWPMAR
jgi:hypothetical protein